MEKDHQLIVPTSWRAIVNTLITFIFTIALGFSCGFIVGNSTSSIASNVIGSLLGLIAIIVPVYVKLEKKSATINVVQVLGFLSTMYFFFVVGSSYGIDIRVKNSSLAKQRASNHEIQYKSDLLDLQIKADSLHFDQRTKFNSMLIESDTTSQLATGPESVNNLEKKTTRTDVYKISDSPEPYYHPYLYGSLKKKISVCKKIENYLTDQFYFNLDMKKNRLKEDILSDDVFRPFQIELYNSNIDSSQMRTYLKLAQKCFCD